MADKLRPYHPRIYFFCLVLLAISLPFSKPVMGLAQLLMLLNWLAEGGLKSKLASFLRNKAALALSAVWFLHLAGLLYSDDLGYGGFDVRTKIPLLLLPLILSTSPRLSAAQLKTLLLFFVAAITVNSLISVAALTGWVRKEITETRGISLFVSHIRFGLMICLSVFILGYYLYHSRSFSQRVLYGMLALWLTVFLFIMGSVTGIVVLIAVVFALLSWLIFRRGKPWLKIAYPLTLALFAWQGIAFVVRELEESHVVKQQVDPGRLDSLTPRGGMYAHELHNKQLENGYYVGLYICWEELEAAWNQKPGVRIRYDALDRRGNEIRFTLVRYLTSKGLRKDADGVNALNAEDVRAIEKGIANHLYNDYSGIRTRIHEIVWEFNEYRSGRDPSGHSVTQRMEFWATALAIIKQDPLFGVGTGDPPGAFAQMYKTRNSPLKEKFRLRSHNQYLAIAVALGLPGLALFLFSLFYPAWKANAWRDYLYAVFFIIIVLSFLNEDTLESQAGVTFYAFFNSLFLFGRSREQQNPLN
ncbi:MAG: O-antigen ligase family protein [Bacteroidota bacterium]